MRFSLLLVTLFCLLTGFSIAPWEETLCRSEYVTGVLRDHSKDGALNCFDFWFNRYQTFIGAIAAIIAAGLAWVGVLRQVDAANKTTEITRAQLASNVLQNLREQRLALERHVDVYGQFEFEYSNMKNLVSRLEDMSKRWMNGTFKPNVRMATREFERHKESFAAALSRAESIIIVKRDISYLDPKHLQVCRDY